MCPKGNDVLDRSNEGDSACDGNVASAEQVQHVCFNAADVDETGTIALVYSDLYGTKYTTTAFTTTASAAHVQTALRSLPDHALESVVVSDVGGSCETTLTGSETVGWAVTFSGAQVSGVQKPLDVLADACGDGCQPKRTGLTNTDYEVVEKTAPEGNAYECGRRGKCDYSTGICECFSGFTDEDCSTQSALA
jgi:hypothetical protein